MKIAIVLFAVLAVAAVQNAKAADEPGNYFNFCSSGFFMTGLKYQYLMDRCKYTAFKGVLSVISIKFQFSNQENQVKSIYL